MAMRGKGGGEGDGAILAMFDFKLLISSTNILLQLKESVFQRIK
jgi:hypothetical protein